MKQSSLDDHESLNMELDASMIGGDNGDDLAELSEYDERRLQDNSDNNQIYSYQNRAASPSRQDSVAPPRGLPWKPKVRQKEIDSFLETSRLKFVGYVLDNDRDTLAGLPYPISEGYHTLNRVIILNLFTFRLYEMRGFNFSKWLINARDKLIYRWYNIIININTSNKNVADRCLYMEDI